MVDIREGGGDENVNHLSNCKRDDAYDGTGEKSENAHLRLIDFKLSAIITQHSTILQLPSFRTVCHAEV
jgi:hypothetical protein